MIERYAPITLFVYNRISHLDKVITSLKLNTLAKKSNLFIFSDGYKNDHDKSAVLQVRDYLKTITGFKKINIIEHSENMGLANSIIKGVTSIVDSYGRVIVLEDDIVTSPYFLNYMNDALDYYQKEKKVWHITGWNYPVDISIKDDVFLWRRMDCWGWATWKDRWKHFEKNTIKLLREFSEEDIHRLNLDSVHPSWSQVLANHEKTMNTWAIFWYTTIFKKNGLCVTPTLSFVDNIGHDGGGEHCRRSTSYNHNRLNLNSSISFIPDIHENTIALEQVKKFYLGKKKRDTV